MKAINKQYGGNHYKKMKLQVVQFCHANNLDFFQGNVVKYVCRFRSKGGINDLNKAIHYLELLKELEYKV